MQVAQVSTRKLSTPARAMIEAGINVSVHAHFSFSFSYALALSLVAAPDSSLRPVSSSSFLS